MRLRKAFIFTVSLAICFATSVQGQNTLSDGIASQPLSDAIQEFADKTGLQVVFEADIAHGKHSNGAELADSNEKVLEQLLASTGISYVFLNNHTVALQAAGGAGGGSPGKTDQTTATGAITGTVTEALYGKALIGALVKIKETDAQVFTNDEGQYRLSKLPAGSYTLEVQFFGFDNQQTSIEVEAGQSISLDFAMVNDQLDPLTVYGQRSAISQAHSEQRAAAHVSTVISESFLGNITGSTVPEVLKTVPGISFTRDNRTGDGSQISVRGLAPDFNTIKINGLVLSAGTGRSRTPDLDGILADSISKITIHKSLLPSHESNGAGGLIEIETKSPLDRNDGYMAFNIEGKKKGGNFGDGYSGSGIISKIFGDKQQFGLSASLQFQKRDVQSIKIGRDLSFKYYPTFADGTLIDDDDLIDPLRQFPWEDFDGADQLYVRVAEYYQEQVKIDNLVATISGAWQLGQHTDLRFDYMRTEKKADSFSAETGIRLSGRYNKLPVAALGGEERFTYVSTGLLTNTNIAFRNEEKRIDALSLQGKTTIGVWDFDYQLGHTLAKTDAPRGHLEMRAIPRGVDFLDLIAPEALDVYGNPTQPWADSDFPIPRLSERGFNALFDPSITEGGKYDDNFDSGENKRTTGLFSSRYNVDGEHIRYIEVGARYEVSEGFNSFTQGLSGGGHGWGFGRRVTAADVGLEIGSMDFSDIGQNYPAIPFIGRETILDFLGRASDLFDQGLLREGNDDISVRNQSNQEDDLSAYLQSEINFGKFQFIGGLRYNRVKVISKGVTASRLYYDAEWNSRHEDEGFPGREPFTRTATVSDVLPRMVLNYRFSDNTLLRTGYHTTVTRPSILQLSNAVLIDVILPIKLVLFQAGNPALKPSYTDNYDLTFEHYMGNMGIIKLGGFYKHISNHLTNNSSSPIRSKELVLEQAPDHPLFDALADPVNDDVEFSFNQPVNGDSGTIWGIESEFLIQFDRLPGWWAGLGMLANYTYTNSSVDEIFNYDTQDGQFAERIISVPFESDPKHTGVLGLSYNMAGIDASLIYSIQGKSINRARAFGYHSGVDTAEFLDFRISYSRPVGDTMYQVYFEGLNLLKGTGDSENTRIQGGFGSGPKVEEDTRYYGGRNFVLGLRATF